MTDKKSILAGFDYENLHDNFTRLWSAGLSTSKIMKVLNDKIYREIAGSAKEIGLEQFAVFDLDLKMYSQAKRELNELLNVTQIRSAYNIHKGGASDTGIIQEFIRRLIIPLDRSKPDYVVLFTGDSDFGSWAQLFQSVNLNRKFYLVHNSQARQEFRENHVWAKTWNFDDLFDSEISERTSTVHHSSICEDGKEQLPLLDISRSKEPRGQCKFFGMGICREGVNCAYRHDLGEARGTERGQEEKNIEKLLTHTTSDSTQFRSQCRYFNLGICRDGDSCAYRHDVSEAERRYRREMAPFYDKEIEEVEQGEKSMQGSSFYTVSNPAQSRSQCKFFEMGSCREGLNCAYRHDVVRDVAWRSVPFKSSVSRDQ